MDEHINREQLLAWVGFLLSSSLILAITISSIR
jgi:hypothetical protein